MGLGGVLNEGGQVQVIKGEFYQGSQFVSKGIRELESLELHD